MQKIIVLAGDSKSGKDTLCNYGIGLVLKRVRSELHPNGVISDFKIDESGNLLVNTKVEKDGKPVDSYGVLDLYRWDYLFEKWADNNIWPYTKKYAFATPGKRAISDIFGIPYKELFHGDKKSELDIKINRLHATIGVEQLPFENDFKITVRDFLVFFLNRICRSIDPFCHAKRCWTQVLTEQIPIVFVADMRFVDEFSCRPDNCTVIKLTKNASEKFELNDVDCDYTIDNANLSLEDTFKEFENILNSVGVFDNKLG